MITTYDDWKLSSPEESFYSIDLYYETAGQIDDLENQIKDLEDEYKESEKDNDQELLTTIKEEIEVLNHDLEELKLLVEEMENDKSLMNKAYENGKY